MRRVLRRREIVADDWRHVAENSGATTRAESLIVPLAELRALFDRKHGKQVWAHASIEEWGNKGARTEGGEDDVPF